MEGGIKNEIKNGPKPPLVYWTVKQLQSTAKWKVFVLGVITILSMSIALAAGYGGFGCSTGSFIQRTQQGFTHYLGAAPDRIDMSIGTCTLLYTAATALSVGIKSVAFAVFVAVLQSAEPEIIFSRVLCVRMRNGVPCLICRVDCPASRALIDLQVTGEYIHAVHTSEGERFLSNTPIKFMAPATMQVAIEAEHRIDATSPLFGLPLDAAEGIVSVQCKGIDVLTRRGVRAATMYMCDSDLRLGQRFRPINTVSPFVAVAEKKDIVSDLESFHESQEIRNEMQAVCNVTNASVQQQLLNMYGGDRETASAVLIRRKQLGLSRISENSTRDAY